MTECEAFEAAMAETPDLGRLTRETRAHAAGCVRCGGLLSEIESIVDEARDLPTPEPPARIWEQVRRQLQKEGVIRANARPAKPRARAAAAPRLVQSAPRSSS